VPSTCPEESQSRTSAPPATYENPDSGVAVEGLPRSTASELGPFTTLESRDEVDGSGIPIGSKDHRRVPPRPRDHRVV